MSDNVAPAHTPGLASRAGLFLSLCGVGGLSALLLMPEPPAHAAREVDLQLAGESIAPHAEPAQQARELAQRYLGKRVTLRAGDVELSLRRADLGVEVDLQRLRGLLERAQDPRSSMRRVHEAELPGSPLALPMPAQLDTDRVSALLVQLKDRIDRPARDAHIDPRKKQAIEAQPGLSLDTYASLERIDRALARGETSIDLPALEIPAKVALSQLAHVDMRAVLGDFTTRYARGPELQDRIHNLRVAAARIDGYVIEPGAVFDFNAVVGDRTELSGFRMAKVIADGELVDGVGGGTCQIASTLHAAVFFAGLPILTRSPHSHPSYYIKLGLDAAVAYGSLNFRFKNDRPFPIVLEATVEDGFVYAALHGRERSQTVTFLRRIDETMPFEEKIVRDETLPHGMRILQQRGIPGFKITRFRVVKDETTQVATRERTTDVYPPTTQIWREGSGTQSAIDFKPPKNDAHPEYVADEFMSAIQGAHTDGIEAESTPGRTGSYGWTEREGMLKRSGGG